MAVGDAAAGGLAVGVVLHPLDDCAVGGRQCDHVEVGLLGVEVAGAAAIAFGAVPVRVRVLIEDDRLVDVKPAVNVLPPGLPGLPVEFPLLEHLPPVVKIDDVRPRRKVFLDPPVQSVVLVLDDVGPGGGLLVVVVAVLDLDEAVAVVVAVALALCCRDGAVGQFLEVPGRVVDDGEGADRPLWVGKSGDRLLFQRKFGGHSSTAGLLVLSASPCVADYAEQGRSEPTPPKQHRLRRLEAALSFLPCVAGFAEQGRHFAE